MLMLYVTETHHRRTSCILDQMTRQSEFGTDGQWVTDVKPVPLWATPRD